MILNTYSAHRDPKLWNKPDLFNPERFLENGKVVNADKLIPFGLGNFWPILLNERLKFL